MIIIRLIRCRVVRKILCNYLKGNGWFDRLNEDIEKENVAFRERIIEQIKQMTPEMREKFLLL